MKLNIKYITVHVRQVNKTELMKITYVAFKCH